MFIKSQKGAALPLILILTVFFTLLIVGLAPYLQSEIRASSSSQNRLISRYAAEAGAKLAIRDVRDQLTNGILPENITSPSPYNPRISAVSPATFGLTYTPIPALQCIQIQSTSTFNNSSERVGVRVFYTPTVIVQQPQNANQLTNLLGNANYSHTDHNPSSSADKEVRWNINNATIPSSAAPPNGETCQVMFNNPVPTSNPSAGMSLSFNAACQVFDTSRADAGYGIYYGARSDSNADNLKSYVFQYDPGAKAYDSRTNSYLDDGGSFFVKKHIFNNSTVYPIGDREWNTEDGYNANQQKNWADPFQKANDGEIMRLSLHDVKANMERWYKMNGDPADDTHTYDINGNHRITIVVKENPSDHNKLWHYIYCDDNPTPLLNFTDHSGTDSTSLDNYVARNFRGTRSGLRVWNVNVNFFNYTIVNTSNAPGNILWMN